MTMLPAEFQDLDKYSDWCLETETERYDKRLASSMAELQDFYDVAMPRLQAMKDYLDTFPLDDLPEDATRLMWLCYSLVNVSFPIECWRQARVPDSGASAMISVIQPGP